MAELFAQANEAFVEESYSDALALYSKAILQVPNNPDYFLKRSICNAKLSLTKDSISDASAALKLAEEHKNASLIAKSLNRIGMGLFAEKDYVNAKMHFDKVSGMTGVESEKKIAGVWSAKCAPFVPVETPKEAPKVENAPAPAAEQEKSIPQQQPPLPPAKIRHEWFQNDEFITIELFAKKVDPKNVSVDFAPRSIAVLIKLPTGSDFSFDLDPLSHEIVPEQSKFTVLSTKIEFKVKKAQIGVKWGILEGEEVGAQSSMFSGGSDKPVYPSSAKKRVDWSSVEKSVEEEKPEGEQALNSLFQQIYRDSNDDVRKAMIKSFTESGGTALSTNWEEVSAKKVEISPPEGMVAKKYEKFSDESIRLCKELASFLRKLQNLEADYARNLAKISQSFKRQNIPLNDKSEKAQLYQSTVWKSYMYIVDQTINDAEAHRVFSNSLLSLIHDPFNNLVREMETARKTAAEKDTDYTRKIQEAKSVLKKSQKDFDNLASSVTDLSNSVKKAETSGVKEKDVDKIITKWAKEKEKLKLAEELLGVHDDLYKDLVSNYNTIHMPALIEEFRTKEEDRFLTTKQALVDFVQLEKGNLSDKLRRYEMITEVLKSLDVAGDMEDYEDNNLSTGDKSTSQVSVESLTMPIMLGKILFKRGDSISGWRRKFAVLHGYSIHKLLYIFDTEESLKPREVIQLQNAQTHYLDDSYFNKSNCLQIISRPPYAKSNASLTTPISIQKQVYNLSFESGEERDEWVMVLRYHSSCCRKCSSVFGSGGNELNREGVTMRRSEGVRSHSSSGTSPGSIVDTPTNMVRHDETEYPALNFRNYRMIRSIKLHLIEAKDLELPSIYGALTPYCVCLLDDVKMARSSISSGEKPFWGEEFKFRDIAPHHSRVRILFLSANRIQKDVDIGHFSINLNALQPNKKIEEWFTIKSILKRSTNGQSAEETGAKVGSVRLGITLMHEKLLPIELYDDFIVAIRSSDFACIKALGNVANQKGDVASSVLHVLMSMGKEVIGIKELLLMEIEQTDDPNILFRGNTIGTKAMDKYLKIIGTPYLHNTLLPFVHLVLKNGESCEIDPSRLSPTDDLVKNHSRLHFFIKTAWDAIKKSWERCPKELVEIFGYISGAVEKRWKGNDSAQYSAVSGFLFLRFFGPAILNPKLFGFIKEFLDPKSNSARTFTLVAKVIQNLANLTEFGRKEPFMSGCNAFIQSHSEQMILFLERVSTPNLKEFATQPPSPRPKIDYRVETEGLYQHFAQNITELTAYAATVTEPALNALFPILAELDHEHTQYDNQMERGSADALNGKVNYGSTSSLAGISGSPPRLSLNLRGTDDRLSLDRSRKSSVYESSEEPTSFDNLDLILRNIVNSSFSFSFQPEDDYFSTKSGVTNSSSSNSIGMATNIGIPRKFGETRDVSDLSTAIGSEPINIKNYDDESKYITGAYPKSPSRSIHSKTSGLSAVGNKFKALLGDRSKTGSDSSLDEKYTGPFAIGRRRSTRRKSVSNNERKDIDVEVLNNRSQGNLSDLKSTETTPRHSEDEKHMDTDYFRIKKSSNSDIAEVAGKLGFERLENNVYLRPQSPGEMAVKYRPMSVVTRTEEINSGNISQNYVSPDFPSSSATSYVSTAVIPQRTYSKAVFRQGSGQGNTSPTSSSGMSGTSTPTAFNLEPTGRLSISDEAKRNIDMLWSQVDEEQKNSGNDESLHGTELLSRNDSKGSRYVRSRLSMMMVGGKKDGE
ncbi:Ras GTPase-activating protein 1 [Nowakowskiella sp. JEL0407]|nr:Ras GTPase-activating protein 1 [Nowakowskiella sp. JEL0407]